MRRMLLCLFLISVILLGSVGCGPLNSPVGEIPSTGSEPALPADVTALPVGVWRGTGSFTDVFLILRESGIGAILTRVRADGGAFQEDIYLGTEITWEAERGELFLDPKPVTFPGGAIYTPDFPPTRRGYRLEGELLTLTEDGLTELYVSAEEPKWYTPLEYSTALADWLIGPDAENAEALYQEFYRIFAEEAEEG